MPSLPRIIQDVDRFAKAVKRIIESKGAHVEEYNSHHGHHKVIQKAVKGGELFVTKDGVLTTRAMEGMKELEKS